MDDRRRKMTEAGEAGPETGAENEPCLISARGVSRRFQGNGGTVEVLNRLSLSFDRRETVAVVGPSGIGKSTLLHVLGTLDRPDEGEIFFNGENLLNLDGDRLARFRNRNIGFVFQFHHLLPEFTALENVMMPRLIDGAEKKEAARSAEELLFRVGLENRLRHRVSDLSGGEQQRVALARALVQHPLLLLADEPTGNLDKKNSEQIHELLDELNSEYGMTLVVVTHSMDLAAHMSRRVTLSDGKLVES